MRKAVDRHDLAGAAGRVFVVGDLHGRFNRLVRELDLVGYDVTRDRLVLLGDLVNKGPESHLAIMWAEHLRVLGNHEAALADLKPREIARPGGQHEWLRRLGDEGDRRRAIAVLTNAPTAIEMKTPRGRRVGFVHAAVPFMDWDDAVGVLDDPSHSQHMAALAVAQNGRDHARGVATRTIGRVAGVDHVFLGHSPQIRPTTWGNTTLMDTGRDRQRPVTVVDVDDYIDKQGTAR